LGLNTFDHPEMRRIRREEIDPTLRYIGSILAPLGITHEVLSSGTMGSTGKQDTSGDIDVALDWDRFPKGILWDVVKSLPQDILVETRQIPGNCLITGWPIVSHWDNGPVFAGGRTQLDLIWGEIRWLKFIFRSPGRDRSPYPGAMINSTLHQLGHLFPIWEYQDAKGAHARIEWHLDFAMGLQPSWKYEKQPGQTPGPVDPDFLETRYPTCPRIPRTGLMREPEVICRILLGETITPQDIETFEQLWAILSTKWPNDLRKIKHHMVKYLITRTPLKKIYTWETMTELEIWRDTAS
jgi:hypothetical protein